MGSLEPRVLEWVLWAAGMSGEGVHVSVWQGPDKGLGKSQSFRHWGG